jgi:sec-independent protein translocase protein TatB
MLDLGLTKLALIGVVALVVIGPEKLPKVARMAGTLFGRAQRYINEVKAEVSREFEMDELRKMQQEVQSATQDVERSIAGNLTQTRQELETAWQGNESVAEPVPYIASDYQLARKAKDFRRKKLARNSAVPGWYKASHGQKQHVMSGAARVARFRPAQGRKTSFF